MAAITIIQSHVESCAIYIHAQAWCVTMLLCIYIALQMYVLLIAAPIVAVIAVLHYVNCASSLCLLVLETIHRVLQCSNANCDWSVTSVEALPHREVTLVLSPSPSMHVSLLYQTNSLEYQLQLQEAVNHRHRLGILIYLNSLYP